MADINWSDDDAVLGLFADNSDDEADFMGFLPQDMNAVLAKVPLSDFAPERDDDLQSDIKAIKVDPSWRASSERSVHGRGETYGWIWSNRLL